jgi:hypothetical protein
MLAAGAAHLGGAGQLLLSRVVEDYRAGGGSLADCLGQLVALVGSDHVARSLQAAAVAGQVQTP